MRQRASTRSRTEASSTSSGASSSGERRGSTQVQRGKEVEEDRRKKEVKEDAKEQAMVYITPNVDRFVFASVQVLRIFPCSGCWNGAGAIPSFLNCCGCARAEGSRKYRRGRSRNS